MAEAPKKAIMDDHKYIPLIGEVFWRGAPVKIPDKPYKKRGYFCLKCETRTLQNDKSYKIEKDYFVINVYHERHLEKIREGYTIKCLVKRNGNLWIKDGEMQIKNDYRKDIYYGQYPIVFESYHLVGEIEILDKGKDKEAIKDNNDQFVDDLPF